MKHFAKICLKFGMMPQKFWRLKQVSLFKLRPLMKTIRIWFVHKMAYISDSKGAIQLSLFMIGLL